MVARTVSLVLAVPSGSCRCGHLPLTNNARNPHFMRVSRRSLFYATRRWHSLLYNFPAPERTKKDADPLDALTDSIFENFPSLFPPHPDENPHKYDVFPVSPTSSHPFPVFLIYLVSLHSGANPLPFPCVLIIRTSL